MIERQPPVSSNFPSRLLILPIWLIAIYTIGLVMSAATDIFLWIVCAFFLFVTLDPIAEFLKFHKWPKIWTAVFLIFTATVISGGLIYGLGTLFSGMIGELQQSKKIFMHSFDSANTLWHSWSSKFAALFAGPNPEEDIVKVEVVQSGSPLGSELGGTILHGLGSAATVMTFSLLVPILAFFFLAERDAFARVLGRAYIDKESGRQTWKKIVKSTRAFFVGNLVLGLITYPIFVLMFWLFSAPSVFTVAALATVFNLVPFAGAVLSGFLPAVTLYSQTQTLGTPLALYGCCIVIHFAVADFVTPKILGSQVNINATTSTIALVAWGEMWGGVGLILAIPLTSLIKIMFEHSDYFWLQWIAGLMSENVDLALEIPKIEIPKFGITHSKDED